MIIMCNERLVTCVDCLRDFPGELGESFCYSCKNKWLDMFQNPTKIKVTEEQYDEFVKLLEEREND